MYQALLIRKYLTSKIMPVLSVLAVMGCTATVLIVWSIMGGFLGMLLNSSRTMVGDVSIEWPTVGFAHYQELIERLERDDLVEAATPVIKCFGMVNLPDNRVEGVQVMGVDGESFARVTGFADSLWWRKIDKPLAKDSQRSDPRLGEDRSELYRHISPEFDDEGALATLYNDGLTLRKFDPDTDSVRPAVVLGIELSGYSQRQSGGWYEPAGLVYSRTETGGLTSMDGFIPNHKVTLNVLPTDSNGRGISVTSRRLPIANEFRSGVFEFDSQMLLIRIEELQRMLKMDPGERVILTDDPFEAFETGGPIVRDGDRLLGVEPGRVTTVLVKGAPGVEPMTLRERCTRIYADFAGQYRGEVPSSPGELNGILISTFEQQQQTLVAAVQKETALVLGILIFISLVVSFLILSIFWSMVSEKTKDIGVLRSLGAGSVGVAWLWLRYGVIIGVGGSLLGGTLASIIVWNINPIHDWLGRAFNLTIWDPRVYYLFRIPNEVDPVKAGIVICGGVLLSVLGAFIPAWRAARMDPVQALRFE